MAIISSIPGLEVWINVDGKPATEYDDPNKEAQGVGVHEFHVPLNHGPEPPYIIKYIEAKHGAPFSFHYLGTPSVQIPDWLILPRFWIDGTKVLLEYDTKYDPVRGAPVTTASHSCDPTNGYQRRSFVFSPFQIVETEQVPEKGTEDMKHCGTLQVSFSYIAETLDHFQHDIRPHNNGGHTGAHTITKKALNKGKGVDCKTAHIPSPNDPTRTKFDTYNHYFVDAERRPFALYEFRYRSKEGLIKERIIPRPTAKDEIDTTADAVVRHRLANNMEEQNQRSLGGVKRQASVEFVSARETENDSRIKHETPATVNDEFRTRYKTRQLDNGCVEVDLTDD